MDSFSLPARHAEIAGTDQEPLDPLKGLVKSRPALMIGDRHVRAQFFKQVPGDAPHSRVIGGRSSDHGIAAHQLSQICVSSGMVAVEFPRRQIQLISLVV